MLSPHVRIDGFDVSDWLALGAFLRSPDLVTEHTWDAGEAGASRVARGGGLFVLRDGDSVVKVVSTSRGRLAPPDGPVSMDTLTAEHGAEWALAAERDALPQVMDRLAERLLREDDLLDQVLKAAHVLQELSREGRIGIYPKDARLWKIPRRATLDRALDVLCPIGKVILIGAFERGEIATSIALRRGRRGFDRVTGPSEVRGELGLVSGDFSRDCHGLVRAVELAVGPVAFGAFAPMTTWQTLIHGDAPGRWAAAIAAREVVIHPLAPAVAIPLGLDLGRAALSVGRKLAQRIGLSGQAGGRVALGAIERLRDSGAGKDAERMLGFDPLALFSEALSFFAEER